VVGFSAQPNGESGGSGRFRRNGNGNGIWKPLALALISVVVAVLAIGASIAPKVFSSVDESRVKELVEQVSPYSSAEQRRIDDIMTRHDLLIEQLQRVTVANEVRSERNIERLDVLVKELEALTIEVRAATVP